MFNFEDYEFGGPSHRVDVAQLLPGNAPPMGIARSRIESPGTGGFLPFGGG